MNLNILKKETIRYWSEIHRCKIWQGIPDKMYVDMVALEDVFWKLHEKRTFYQISLDLKFQTIFL